MQINGKLAGKLEKLTMANNKSRDGQTAIVDFITRMNRPDCEASLGVEFSNTVAFGGMVKRATTDSEGKVDGGEEIVHLIKSPQPTGKVVMQIHKIRMLGRVLEKIQPSIGCNGVQGEEKVDVTIRFPVDISVDETFDTKMLATFKASRALKIDFTPKQGVLDFQGAKAKADAAGE